MISNNQEECRKDSWLGYLRVCGLGRGLNDVPTRECRTLMTDHSGGRFRNSGHTSSGATWTWTEFRSRRTRNNCTNICSKRRRIWGRIAWAAYWHGTHWWWTSQLGFGSKIWTWEFQSRRWFCHNLRKMVIFTKNCIFTPEIAIFTPGNTIFAPKCDLYHLLLPLQIPF